MSSEALVVFEIDRKSKNAKLVLLSWHKICFLLIIELLIVVQCAYILMLLFSSLH